MSTALILSYMKLCSGQALILGQIADDPLDYCKILNLNVVLYPRGFKSPMIRRCLLHLVIIYLRLVFVTAESQINADASCR